MDGQWPFRACNSSTTKSCSDLVMEPDAKPLLGPMQPLLGLCALVDSSHMADSRNNKTSRGRISRSTRAIFYENLDRGLNDRIPPGGPQAAKIRWPKAANELLRFVALKSACKESVLARLKAPATSDFPEPIDIRRNKKDASAFFVMGAVDAQNGFGAKLRQNYLCELKAGADWNTNTVTKVSVDR